MTRSTCRIVLALAACAALHAASQPTFAQASGAGTPPASGDWTPANVIALITAVASAIVAIVGALRGTAAQSKSDANEQRLNSVSSRLDAHGQQITDIARNMVPPSMLPQMQAMGQPQAPDPPLPGRPDMP